MVTALKTVGVVVSVAAFWFCVRTGEAASLVHVQGSFSTNAAAYRAVGVSPVFFYTTRLRRLHEKPELEKPVEEAQSALTAQFSGDMVNSFQRSLEAKGFNLVGPMQRIRGPADWGQIELSTRELLAAMQKEFDEISRALQADVRRAKQVPFNFKLSAHLKELVDTLQLDKAQAIIFLDARGIYLSPIPGADKGVINGIQYNMAVVDAHTGEVLWWNSHADRQVNGHDAALTEASVKALLEELPTAEKKSK